MTQEAKKCMSFVSETVHVLFHLAVCHCMFEILKETTGYGLKLSNCAVTDKNLDMSQIDGN